MERIKGFGIILLLVGVIFVSGCSEQSQQTSGISNEDIISMERLIKEVEFAAYQEACIDNLSCKNGTCDYMGMPEKHGICWNEAFDKVFGRTKKW